MDGKIKAAQEEAGKTGFVLSGQELFGRYARIAYGLARYGREPGVQDYHIYKVIQNFRSNAYCDVPLTYQTENNCYVHDEVVDVVNVIHCGIDESRVIRVAFQDIELLPIAGEWVDADDRLPEIGSPVQVTYIGFNTGRKRSDLIAAHDGESWRFWDCEMREELKVPVTHWAPLRQPPREV